MRPLLVLLIMLTAALAGCTSDDGSPDDSNSGTDGVDSGGDSGTDSGAPGTDGGSDDGNVTDDGNETAGGNTTNVEAPVGSFEADQTEGVGSMDVTFTFNGSDADSSALTWTLDAGGDETPELEGTEANLPGNFTYSYASPGETTATFFLTDGEFNHTLTIEIVVAEPEPVGEPEPEDDGDPWVETDADGYCHAEEGVTAAGPLYIHDRDEGPDDGVPGTGFTAGGGTWVYEEANGVEGLQVGGDGETGPYVGCYQPDLLIF